MEERESNRGMKRKKKEKKEVRAYPLISPGITVPVSPKAQNFCLCRDATEFDIYIV